MLEECKVWRQFMKYPKFFLNVYNFITFLQFPCFSVHLRVQQSTCFLIPLKKLLCLSVETIMHHFLHFIIICKLSTSQRLLHGFKQMKTRSCKVWTVWCVVRFQFLKGILGMGSRMRAGAVMVPILHKRYGIQECHALLYGLNLDRYLIELHCLLLSFLCHWEPCLWPVPVFRHWSLWTGILITASVTLFQPFLNISMHSYTLHWGKTLPHIQYINSCEFQPLLHPPPIKTNHSPFFILCENGQWC